MFLRFWFSLCSFFGPGLGSVLAAPFFRSCVPPSWSRRRGRWVRRWPAASSCFFGRPAAGVCARWVRLPFGAAVPAGWLRPVVGSPACCVAVAPAVVVRWGRFRGLVVSLWAFVVIDDEANINEERGFKSCLITANVSFTSVDVRPSARLRRRSPIGCRAFTRSTGSASRVGNARSITATIVSTASLTATAMRIQSCTILTTFGNRATI